MKRTLVASFFLLLILVGGLVAGLMFAPKPIERVWVGLGLSVARQLAQLMNGDLELGDDELDMHRALADHPAMTAIRRVDCVGPRMKALYDALPAEKRGRWAEDAKTLAAEAQRLIDAGDVVLVKGSKGSRVSLVVDALRRLHQAGDEGTD